MASFDIFTACLNGQANLVASAISRDHELINKQDPNSDGRTALHHACTAGSLDTVTALLSTNRADVNARDGSGFTPLLVACAAGQLGIVQALIGAGADVTATNARGQTGLHYAASRGNVPVATALLAKGADVNARDRGGQLPLHRAASMGSVPFIQLVLKANPGAKTPSQGKPRLNTLDNNSNTPLHLAIESGHAEAAVVLIEGGADRERLNGDGVRAEDMEGVGGQEARKVKAYIISHCGRAGE